MIGSSSLASAAGRRGSAGGGAAAAARASAAAAAAATAAGDGGTGGGGGAAGGCSGSGGGSLTRGACWSSTHISESMRRRSASSSSCFRWSALIYCAVPTKIADFEALTATPASVSTRRNPSICDEISFDRFCSRWFRSRRRCTWGTPRRPLLPAPLEDPPPVPRSSPLQGLEYSPLSAGPLDVCPGGGRGSGAAQPPSAVLLSRLRVA